MINIHRLMAEDPGFVVYAQRVMDELTGHTAEEWIYELWKAYQHDTPPAEFVKDFNEGKI